MHRCLTPFVGDLRRAMFLKAMPLNVEEFIQYIVFTFYSVMFAFQKCIGIVTVFSIRCFVNKEKSKFYENIQTL